MSDPVMTVFRKEAQFKYRTTIKTDQGYRLYSKEDYLLLKRLHHAILLDRKATCQFERWLSKYPHRRKGPRPPCIGTKATLYQHVLHEYEWARKIFPEPVTIKYPDKLGRWYPEVSNGIASEDWKELIPKYLKD